jgi:hypothetical protein
MIPSLQFSPYVIEQLTTGTKSYCCHKDRQGADCDFYDHVRV